MQNNDSSDDEGPPTRPRNGEEPSVAEGIDESSLVDAAEASKRFRRAERKRLWFSSFFILPLTHCILQEHASDTCMRTPLHARLPRRRHTRPLSHSA